MTSSAKVILVFGLPGAGKSTLINNLISTRPEYIRLSGGSLISGDISEAERDKLRKLGADEVLKNQELLVINFQKALQNNREKTVIFDGHCMIKNADSLIEIPLDIIRRLTPSLIVFINPSAALIHSRRTNDPNRPDREIETIENIDALKTRQINICQQYSGQLGIPLYIFDGSNIDDFEKVISSV
jgi:adenylate kinase